MRLALQFLTILPVPAPAMSPGRAAWAFAVVGTLLGLCAAAVWGVKFGPLLIVMGLALVTGGLHEDGLADVCDAIRGHRSREKMLEILKDSRIGAHGALALIASFAFRWQALAALQGDAWMRLPAVFGISRAAMVVLAGTTAPVGSGLGRAFGESLPRGAVAIAVAQCVLLAALAGWGMEGAAASAVLAGWRVGAVLLGANAMALLLLRWWFRARLGGVTGDCLGCMCQVSEAVSLGVLACL